jgi:hypothetical protein
MKSVKITGTNNRYQMKKVTKENELYKYRSRVLTNGWDPSLYSAETQMNVLQEIKNTIEEMDILNHSNKLMKKEIEHKLNGYKSQDQIKKRNGVNITFLQTVDKLLETNLLCYYCGIQCNIFYERVREMTQWSFDRIDNDLCHSVDNVVLACLKCNLHRKTMNSKRFKDAKDMKKVVLIGQREEESSEILEPFSEAPEAPKVSTIISQRLIEKLANNIVVNDSVVVSVQEEIH